MFWVGSEGPQLLDGMQTLPHLPSAEPSVQEAEAYWGVNIQSFQKATAGNIRR